MGFFTKMFASVKNTIVASVVETKITKLEKQLNDSVAPMTIVINKIFGLYSSASTKGIKASADIITNNKKDIVDLVSENADTLKRIADLVKQLDTERNRMLIGNIAKSAIQTIKDVNNDMQKEFETDFPLSIKPACDAVNAIWDIKPRKRKVSDVVDAKPTISISKMIGEGKKVMIRETRESMYHDVFEMRMWIDNEEVDTIGSDFDWANHEIVDTVESGLIKDIYFYDIALDTAEQIDSRFL